MNMSRVPLCLYIYYYKPKIKILDKFYSQILGILFSLPFIRLQTKVWKIYFQILFFELWIILKNFEKNCLIFHGPSAAFYLKCLIHLRK